MSSVVTSRPMRMPRYFSSREKATLRHSPGAVDKRGASLGVVGLVEMMWVLSVLMPKPEYGLNWLMRGMASMMV